MWGKAIVWYKFIDEMMDLPLSPKGIYTTIAPAKVLVRVKTKWCSCFLYYIYVLTYFLNERASCLSSREKRAKSSGKRLLRSETPPFEQQKPGGSRWDFLALQWGQSGADERMLDWRARKPNKAMPSRRAERLFQGINKKINERRKIHHLSYITNQPKFLIFLVR